MNRTVISNGRVVTQERLIPDGGICIENGVITEVFEGRYSGQTEDATVLDAAGRYIAPGFIDIHVHGGGGKEFMCDNPEDVIIACMTHLRHGTTSIVPTTSSAEQSSFLKSMTSINKAAESMKDGPNILGIHMEGPYFSPAQCGAQDPKSVRNPDPAEYIPILDRYPNVIRWSIAPELPGAIEMAAELRRRGVRLSIGHSDALYDDVIRAYESGFTTITHFYSCTSTVRRIHAYRYAGIIEAGYQLDDMTVEIIADGKHLPASLLKLIYKIKGPDHICLVTDAVSPAGLTHVDGELYSKTCGTNVVIEDDVAKLPDRSAFAGSIATTDRLVRTMIRLAGVPVTDAVKMMASTPAKNLGIFDHKGSIVVGKDADIVLFDDAIHVSTVLVGGKVLVQE